jgi:hypothetical protein
MHVCIALSAVLSIWSLCVILLSMATPRYVTLFTKGISRHFSCNTSLGTLKFYEEEDDRNFPIINLYVSTLTPRFHCSEAARQFAKNTTLMFLCRVSIVRE